MMRYLCEMIRLIIESGELDDNRIKRNASFVNWRSNRDESFEDEIEELRHYPEFVSPDTFVSYKLDNDEYAFNASELQALARNADEVKLGHEVFVASRTTTEKIKNDLIDVGLTFDPRRPVKFLRGGMSSAHGSHPFAGSGGGGSGFGSGFGGPTFTSFGGGPGSIGGDDVWDPDDKKNLKMGARKR